MAFKTKFTILVDSAFANVLSTQKKTRNVSIIIEITIAK
jgi:hypothetical protein